MVGATGPNVQSIFFNSGGNLGGGTGYLRYGSQVVGQTQAQILIVNPGTLRNMYVYVEGQTSGQNSTFTVCNGAATTTLSTTIVGSGPTASNIVDSVAVTTFDRISLQYTGNAELATAIVTVNYII
jgi:hypothetical protein